MKNQPLFNTLLGVYGIGLKRALFKLGDHFDITSRTQKNGFRCQLDVKQWVTKDDKQEDWTIPITEIEPAGSLNVAGTTILVDRLHEEVKLRIGSGTVEQSLCHSISTTFCFFLERYIRIVVNGQRVEPTPIPTSKPSKGSVSYERIQDDGVGIRILATLAAQKDTGGYDQTQSGWYVICNGRAVLSADKSELTGWGIPPMPTYQPKNRGFIGLVIFESTDPMKLPWTTTKRGLNRESAIYLRTRNRMAIAARPVLSFMNRQYDPDPDTDPVERQIARTTISARPDQLAASQTTTFNVITPPRAPKVTTRVQYSAKDVDLEKIRKHLKKSYMTAGAIGEHTFSYFLEEEGLS